MDTLSPLVSALGLGVLAGARLYATVLGVGLLLRLNWIALPAGWQHASVLADTRILVAAGIGCVIEFIADKVPWVDSAWDAVHTFVRPIGAALIATSLFSNLEPAYQVLLCLLAGSMALSGHSAKATVRLAVNHSPEPFSNIGLSLIEDVAVAAGLYLLVKHPWLMAGIALTFLALVVWLAPRIYRALRAEAVAVGALLRHWMRRTRTPQLAPTELRWLDEHMPGRPRRLFAVIATGDLKGLRNARGTLCLTGSEAVFFSRRWARPVARQIGPPLSVEMKRGLLLDKLVLTAAGQRVRFDLLAGQLDPKNENGRLAAPALPSE